MKKIRNQILLVTSIILLAFSCSVLVGLIVTNVNAQQAWVGATIGAMGNVIGGVIGGFVAYFVAAYQIEKSDQKDIVKVTNKYKNLITVLVEELHHNKIVLKAIQQNGVIDEDILKEQVHMTAWDYVKYEISSIVPSLSFRRISMLFRQLGVLKTCSPEEMTIDDISTKIPEIEAVILELEDVQKKL
ncbi:hypothetical protein [Paenibacillus paridis]|uniref:hypothetical protein n=1 Tax=Paenibacillus paridis TaxID=2583376 RepID=UPI00111F9AD8|nr:hypothetical protein [Paenibacillus paridis]